MKYLVTGGTGFLGRAVVDQLLKENHSIRVLDNNFRGKTSRLPKSEHIEIVEGDIRDSEFVRRAAKGVDSILHLAFINGTRYFYEQPDLVVDVGIRGMLNVADAAKINNVKEIVLVSTSETYQSPTLIPTPENVPLVVPDILNPRYSYGGAKIASELILVNYCSPYLENWKIIRPHNIYGPDMGGDHVIPSLIKKAIDAVDTISIQGDGTQMRSFCYIDDFARAFQIILGDENRNQIYHVGSQDEITIRDLTDLISGLLGKVLEILPTNGNVGETLRRCPDITKLRQLGFFPETKLNEGLRKTIDSYSKAIE